jgi:hypothetical protein
MENQAQRFKLLVGRWHPNQTVAMVAELADAPDFEIANQRFQSITFRFKRQSFYERKTCVFQKIDSNTNGE